MNKLLFKCDTEYCLNIIVRKFKIKQLDDNSNCLEKDEYFDTFTGAPLHDWVKITRDTTTHKIKPLMKDYDNIFEKRRKNQCVNNLDFKNFVLC